MNPPSAIYIKPEPEWTPPPKRQHLSADTLEDTSGDEDFPPASQQEWANPKKEKLVNWETSMKYSHSDAFSRDSDLVKEARAHYFTMHPWDWTQGNMDDLSNIFRGLAQHAGLSDECIFKLQDLWRGPESPKMSQLHSPGFTQRTKFSEGGICQGVPKSYGLKGDS